MAKDAGANKVFTSAAPRSFSSCLWDKYANRDELIAHNKTISQIADLAIDNLVYQVLKLRKSIISDSAIKDLEMSCLLVLM